MCPSPGEAQGREDSLATASHAWAARCKHVTATPCSNASVITPAASGTQVTGTGGGMLAQKEDELSSLQLAERELARLPTRLQQRLQGLSLCLHSGDAHTGHLDRVSAASRCSALCRSACACSGAGGAPCNPALGRLRRLTELRWQAVAGADGALHALTEEGGIRAALERLDLPHAGLLSRMQLTWLRRARHGPARPGALGLSSLCAAHLPGACSLPGPRQPAAQTCAAMQGGRASGVPGPARWRCVHGGLRRGEQPGLRPVGWPRPAAEARAAAASQAGRYVCS